ncbi:nitronate monooxygenase family protein [Ruegeria sp. PrR005]|uniref:Nitronate monooxygenase n=1 Tax=Ruegeria sp. PrR005 TaxID=2706882 RepID=A0A6B2NMY2_9RHOB|nr:nitronate monooxygenase [Ruegeria sp. PrR005]NDW44728.1 nitronate monooxygenase [Ruegeria sp. PrR005]
MIRTRLTDTFGLDYPIVSAPMAKVAGGRLAAAVSRAGGLGLIGGGYCEAEWIETEFANAGNTAVGCGFITWRLAEAPQVLDAALDHGSRAVFLSFGDPRPFAERIHAAGAALICQVQTLGDAREAVEAGARVIVAQGGEAGGHGANRATMTLVPEVADLLRTGSPETLLLAAGGIADGRGLAAALMLGADGVLVGTRFCLSDEALIPPQFQQAGIAASGDQTVATKVVDIVRGYDWPERFRIRVLDNAFTARWQDDLDGLRADPAQHAAWGAALAAGDPSVANPVLGEGIGLVKGSAPAAEIMKQMAHEAEALLAGGWDRRKS